MDFNSKYDFYLKAVEKKIDEYFTPDDILQKNVLDAMWYAITAGGKRVRQEHLQEIRKNIIN